MLSWSPARAADGSVRDYSACGRSHGRGRLSANIVGVRLRRVWRGVARSVVKSCPRLWLTPNIVDRRRRQNDVEVRQRGDDPVRSRPRRSVRERCEVNVDVAEFLDGVDGVVDAQAVRHPVVKSWEG